MYVYKVDLVVNNARVTVRDITAHTMTAAISRALSLMKTPQRGDSYLIVKCTLIEQRDDS